MGRCEDGYKQPIWFTEWHEESAALNLEIMLPGVASVSELELDCSERELEVAGGGYFLQLITEIVEQSHG